MEYTPVLQYTDATRDVDDIEAVAYLAGHPNTEIVSAVTTHRIPDRRALVLREVYDHLGMTRIPIGVGSIFTLEEQQQPGPQNVMKYLDDHMIDGRTYEGEGMIECFPRALDVIHEAIDYYPGLVVSMQAPMTDLALAAEADPSNFSLITRLYIQGNVLVEDERLIPDPTAYNMGEDMEAAKYVIGRFQDSIPLTVVGKFAAYEVPFYKEDFDRFAATGNRAGQYLLTHALQGLTCFGRRDPETLQRIYHVTPDDIDQLAPTDVLSKPYDALVAKVIADPTGMTAEHVGRHALIGMSEHYPGISPATADTVKADLIHTIMTALMA